jgi:hypothetical protein
MGKKRKVTGRSGSMFSRGWKEPAAGWKCACVVTDRQMLERTASDVALGGTGFWDVFSGVTGHSYFG